MSDMTDVLSGGPYAPADAQNPLFPGDYTDQQQQGAPVAQAPQQQQPQQQAQSSPDVDTDAQGAASNPAQAQAPAPPTSKWERVLMGALVGLSGVGHAKNFGEGLSGGAQASVNYGQAQKVNDQRQQQIDMQKQRLALETQQTADAHATAQQQLAVSQANLAILHTQYALMPKTLQETLDRADMTAGEALRSEGTPVVSGPEGLSYSDAQQRIMAERNAAPNSALQFVMHSRPDGKYDVFQINDPNKLNSQPLDVTIGYNVGTGKPITKHFDANSISVAQRLNLETTAATNLVSAQNDLTEFGKKNAITTQGEIKVLKAKQQMDQTPVYAVDPSGQTVLTTKAAAINGGMSAIRGVKEADIAKDQHDIKVLSDIQVKANQVAQTAGAMDNRDWTDAAAAAKYLADNPNTTVNSLLKSTALKNASAKTQAYVIAVNSLRESSLGLQKVLTGSARSNETQLAALLNTLPGYEPNSGIVKQKLDAFTQNLDLLSKGLPKGTGVELKGFGGQPQYTPPAPADIVRSGTLNGQKVFMLRNGSTVYFDGKPVTQ